MPPAFADVAPCIAHQCMVIVDAGSSGSRLHLYSFDRDETHTPINIQEVWSKRIKPGFATLELNAKTIDAYLDSLFAGVPTEGVSVYFYATGGMRLLPTEKQTAYYNQLGLWFALHPKWRLVNAKTITGNEEALYDWLSVNYHLGILQSPNNQAVGVMDMGGASVQVVFPIKKQQDANPGAQIGIDVYGRHIELFVYSALGLGQNELLHQFSNATPCFSNHYPLPDGAEGLGDALSCEQQISPIIASVHSVNQKVQPTLSQNPVDSWYALGGITNVAAHKLFKFEQHQLTNESLLNQADSQVCHQDWAQLNRQFPNDDYVYLYCFLPAYYYALMVEGYGLTPSQTINYLPAEQNVDWTVGAVFQQ
jgi:hypothetical protein